MKVPRCASCGSPLAADAARSSCPVCLLRAGLDGESAATGYRPLDESMERSAGSPHVPIGRGPVLASLSKTIGNLPRVLLRDTDLAGGLGTSSALARPRCLARAGRPAQTASSFLGEIALPGRDGGRPQGQEPPTSAATWRSSFCWSGTRDLPSWSRRFVEEARSPGSSSTPASSRCTNWGRSPPAVLRHEARQGPDARNTPGRTGIAGRRPTSRFLAVFEQVCQTVEAAHSPASSTET